MSTKKTTKAVKAATTKNTKPAKKRVRKPRTEAQKARRRELDAIRRAEAKNHALPKKDVVIQSIRVTKAEADFLREALQLVRKLFHNAIGNKLF